MMILDQVVSEQLLDETLVKLEAGIPILERPAQGEGAKSCQLGSNFPKTRNSRN